MYKRWVFNFLFFGLIFAVIFIGFNFLIDPYGIFGHSNFISKIKNHTASYRMSKVYYIKREKPKTILIGTSRIGVINPKIVEKFTHTKVYNLSLPASSIEEQYEYILFNINRIKVTNIIWGIDFFSFNPESRLPTSFSNDRLNKNFYIGDYKDTLFTVDAFLASIKTLKDNLSHKKNRVNLYNGQNYFLEHKINYKIYGSSFIDKKIKEGLKGYKTTKELFGSKLFKKPKSIDKKFVYIKKIVSLCHKSNIKLTIYVSPIYVKTLQLIYSLNLWNTYKHFQIGLAQIHPFWDFSENLKLISDKNNFWDNSHLREKAADKIIEAIFTQNYNYGKLITLTNVQNHLKYLENYIKKILNCTI